MHLNECNNNFMNLCVDWSREKKNNRLSKNLLQYQKKNVCFVFNICFSTFIYFYIIYILNILGFLGAATKL